MKKTQKFPIWYTAFAGFCSLFIGIGLCRFAYTPLIPALIHQGWVSRAGAGYLGTINFVGYLLGAIFAKHISEKIGDSALIRASLILSALSLAFCAVNGGFVWLAAWRFLAGITGAFLMVMALSFVLRNVSNHYRGRVSGTTFAGMGLGVIVSGLLLPELAKLSVAVAWLSVALFALIAAMIAWPIFSSKTTSTEQVYSIVSARPNFSKQLLHSITLLSIAYALFAVGAIPHSLFLVDYVHTKLGLNTFISGLFWSIFGIGSLIGPFLAGFVGDKVGAYKSLVGAFLLSCIAISLVLYNQITILYIISSFLMGVLCPAIVTFISLRIIELVGIELHPILWGKMTVYYGISQALGAYLMSYLLHKGADYTMCFIIAGLAFLLGFIAVTLTKNPQNIAMTVTK